MRAFEFCLNDRIAHLKSRGQEVPLGDMTALRRDFNTQFDSLPQEDSDIFYLESANEKRELKMERGASRDASVAIADADSQRSDPEIEAPVAIASDMAFVDADAGVLAVRPPPELDQNRGVVVLHGQCARCRHPEGMHPGLPPPDISQDVCLPCDERGNLTMAVGTRAALEEPLRPMAFPLHLTRFQQHRNIWPALK